MLCTAVYLKIVNTDCYGLCFGNYSKPGTQNDLSYSVCGEQMMD